MTAISSKNSITPRRALRASAQSVLTTMSFCTCCTQDGTGFGQPSTSTRHIRHWAGALRPGCQQ